MQEMKQVTEYSSKYSKFKIGVVVLLIGCIIGAYFYFSQKEQNNSYSYITESLRIDDLAIIVSATGYIQPLETIEVGSEVSGTINKMYVDYNDVVKKGQILAQLDKIKYQSAVNKIEAGMNSAKATLENMEALLYRANSTLQRDNKLKESTKGALPSLSDWEQDYANYLSAKAQVSSAKAQVEQTRQTLISAKYDLDKTTIYSPIDGTILEKNIDEGQTVAATFQTPILFKIAKDLTKMELQTSIDEADIATVEANQSVTFSVDAYQERKFKTSISMVRVNSEIVDGVVTYKAVMYVDNKDLLLKPGMSADVNIATQVIKNSFIVPKAALLYIPITPRTIKMFEDEKPEKIAIDSKPHIWLLKNNKPVKVYVKVLGNSGSFTAIESKKLNENDKVITMQEIKK